jgi:DNA-binding LacI/PurR family transcriptional regulator
MNRSGSGRDGRRITLDDVARAAGVSRATASRVVAGYGHASPATRARVDAAAARLGYAPDGAARALANGAGFRLVVAATGMTPDELEEWYVDRIVGSVATVCAPHGIGVSLHWLPLHAPGELRRLADDRSVRGVLLVNTTEQVLRAVPSELTGRIVSIGVGSRTVPSFDVDSAGSTTAIVDHLYAAGRRRIAMVSGPSWLPGAGRSVAAYRTAMLAAGLPARVVPSDFTAASASVAASTVLRRWPDTDALVASSDAIALGAITALRRQARDVPGDVAVTGFDDIPLAGMSHPALTTASHPVGRIAVDAATALIERRRVPPTTLHASELIRRDSA